MSERIATLSFDDGGYGDIDLINYLDGRGIQATFYLTSALLLPSCYRGWHRDRIRDLYELHEIGNHTRTHQRLPDLAANEVKEEVARAQTELDLFFPEQDICCFSYPAGAYSTEARAAVETAGLEFARTCMRSNPEAVDGFRDPMLVPITVAYRRPSDLEPLRSAAEHHLPIHIASHGWEIYERGLLPSLSRALDALVARGYEFRTNYGFFLETQAE